MVPLCSTAISLTIAALKSSIYGSPFWYRLAEVVLERLEYWPLNEHNSLGVRTRRFNGRFPSEPGSPFKDVVFLGVGSISKQILLPDATPDDNHAADLTHWAFSVLRPLRLMNGKGRCSLLRRPSDASTVPMHRTT